MAFTAIERKAIKQAQDNLKSADTYRSVYAPMNDHLDKLQVTGDLKKQIMDYLSSTCLNNLMKPVRESEQWLEALLDEPKKG